MKSRRDNPVPDPVPGRTELMESVFVEMDPICDGFGGVVELGRESWTKEEAYVAQAVSALTGERVVRFVSAREVRARNFYGTLVYGKEGGVHRCDGTTGT